MSYQWKRIALLVAVGLMHGACRPGIDEVPEAPTVSGVALPGPGLDAEQQAMLGLAVSRLDAARYTRLIEGSGIVIDPRPVVRLMAELVRAEAAAYQSQAAETRAASLFRDDAGVSREVLEAAERQAVADASALDVARAEAVISYGSAAPWLDTASRDAIMMRLAAGEASIVQASFPADLFIGPPAELTLQRIGSTDADSAWQTTTVWVGPADPQVPGPVLLAYVESAVGLTPGTRVAASFASGVIEDGVIVPAAAVVIAGGAAWCYVLDHETQFVRTAVDLDRPSGAGYFQSAGLDVGDFVVTAGAGLLLAREMGGAEEAD